MRPLLAGDISSAARALLLVPHRCRPAFCTILLMQAESADLYVRKIGRLHPAYGNGSLMAAARRLKLPDEPLFDDPEYCDCTAITLTQVAKFLRRHAKKKDDF